ncbi:MAG: DUF4198 domain-containing protein [Thiotrichales bacterium]
MSGKRFRRGIRGVVAFVWVLVSGGALAHGYWVERAAGDRFVLYQGHLYAAHAGDERVAYDPAIVKRALCARDDGLVTAATPVVTDAVAVAGPCRAVVFEMSSGYWSQTLAGSQNKPRTEVRGALRSWLSEESIKHLQAWSEAFARPLGDGLELVPLADPFALAAGQKLRVAVFWRGQPLEGATVAYDEKPRGLTGVDGGVNLKLRHAGVQVITATFEEPLRDPRADKVIRTATLQFELKP